MADRVRFYLDEHIPNAVAKGLRQRGIEALTVVEAGRVGYADEDQLDFAQEGGWVLVTFDDDFLRLHAMRHPHAGIVYGQREKSAGSLIQTLVLIASVLSPDEMIEQIEFA